MRKMTEEDVVPPGVSLTIPKGRRASIHQSAKLTLEQRIGSGHGRISRGDSFLRPSRTEATKLLIRRTP